MNFDIFHNKWYIRALKIENELSKKGWKYIGCGSSRRVWKRRNSVLKIPINEKGISSNYKEHLLYRKHRDRYAPCRLSSNCLIMKAVKELDDRLVPDWSLTLRDGPQVGIDNNGNILIFDYAEEEL